MLILCSMMLIASKIYCKLTMPKIKINNKYTFLTKIIKPSKSSISLKNRKEYFNYVEIGSINNSTGYVEPDYKKSIDISTDSVFHLQKNDILISTVRTYLGGIGIINKEKNNLVSSKALIVLRNIIGNHDKNYIFGVLRTKYFIEQTNLILNASMYPRMDKESLDQLKIPFPTINNHQEPEKIEKLVSIITQNIINKEEKINEKNKKIDELIEKELKENQKSGNNFKYSYPKISEIKKESRLDTGIYEREFKEIDFLIRNYEGGFDFIDENNIKGGNTPKKRIFDIGNLWLTPTDCKRGILKNKNLIKSESYNLDQDSLVIVNRSNVGETFLFKTEYFNIAHHNQGMYRVKINKDKYAYYVFILCFFNSFIFQQYINNLSTGSTFKEIRSDELSKKAPIPNFPESKQQEIAKEYYNKIDNNQNLNLDNYLELERQRNDQLGIFQLNMEIFTLREKLEDIIDKIINDQNIELNLNY